MARTMGVPDSLRRCLARPGFVEHFLVLLAERVPQIGIQHADPAVLRMLVPRCLTTLVLAVAGAVPPDEVRAKFHHCGRSCGVDLSPDIFPDWAACLDSAVREFDPLLTPDLVAEWHAALAAAVPLVEGRA